MLKTLSNIKITHLDVIMCILFIVLLVILPDINIQDTLNKIGINTSFKLTLSLVLLLMVALVLYCYSKIIGSIIFICVSLFLKTQFKYVEAFQQPIRLSLRKDSNTVFPKKEINKQTSNKKDFTVEEYLLNQIADDPNKTDLEKKIIQDITQKYFLNSDKLQKLTDFNDESEEYSVVES
tara:strand:+ start:850 stop:1386 length:537 start_codon:yes stop_codon:yes gene_type:complete